MYPETVKLKKQLQYVHKRNISFVAIVGAQEAETHTVALKDMETGAQQQWDLQQLLQKLG